MASSGELPPSGRETAASEASVAEASGQLRPFVQAMAAHLTMHRSLPFTSFHGKVYGSHD